MAELDMHADLQGALNQIDKSWRSFNHRGRRMSKQEVKACLEHGLSKGYKTTAELSDQEVDEVISQL